MQPLKLTIRGSFWDSQIYAGRLYLFTDQGSVSTLRWDELISDWKIPIRLRLALECAFRRSDYLYNSSFGLLLHDEDVKAVINKKFEELSSLELVVENIHQEFEVGEQQSPFPFPHSDTTIYKNQMYAGSGSGLYRATCDKTTVKPLSTKREKKWDGPSFSIDASYNQIAVAAGDFGLYEIPVDYSYGKEPRPTLSFPCNLCSWNFQSIYCSSARYGGRLADFDKIRQVDEGYTERKFSKSVSAEDIFGMNGFSWARQDKMYLASEGKLRIARYSPWENPESRFKLFKDTPILQQSGDIKSAAVANFGTVLEYETALEVILSDGTSFLIEGDPIAWRVFPKSKHYENHLHVIFDDHLVIYSFNQDYFQDQDRKTFGTKHFEFGSGVSRRTWHPVVEMDLDDLLDVDTHADDNPFPRVSDDNLPF